MYEWEFFNADWLWILPLVFMAVFCFLMMRGRILNGKMGCMGNISKDHDGTRGDVETPVELAARRYAAGDIGKEEYDIIVNTLLMT